MERLVLSLSKKRLANGLRVVMSPDPEASTVSVTVTYDVGSRDEVPGRSGFAHLFEHMMFQGSRNVTKGEHFGLISSRGGTLNGTTSEDRTNYFETLPASELALGLWLEADRMHWLAVTPANFENQRAVVQEEYRMRVANVPYRLAMIELGSLVYGDYFPYAHPTIGSMPDLDAAAFDWVKDFHEQHYAPNNAVLSLVGNFDADQAVALIEQYFGAIPSKTVPKRSDAPAPAAPKSPRLKQVDDPNAKTPALLYGWQLPPARTPDHPSLELAARILADGDSSRLYQLLVRERGLARDVSVWTEDRRGPDQFTIQVELTEKADPKSVNDLILAELTKLGKTGPTSAELERARQRLKSGFLFGLQSTQTRANVLGELELYTGDARTLVHELEQLLAVRTQDIARNVTRYLAPELRSTVTVLPKKDAPPPAKVDAPAAPNKDAHK